MFMMQLPNSPCTLIACATENIMYIMTLHIIIGCSDAQIVARCVCINCLISRVWSQRHVCVFTRGCVAIAWVNTCVFTIYSHSHSRSRRESLLCTNIYASWCIRCCCIYTNYVCIFIYTGHLHTVCKDRFTKHRQ